MKRNPVIVDFLVSACLAGMVAYGVAMLFSNEKIKLLDIPVKHYSARIEIWTESFQENYQPLYYRINNGGQIDVPMTYFGNTGMFAKLIKKDFVLYYGKHDHLVGLAFAGKPNRIVLMHDYANGANWPRRGYVEKTKANYARGRAMLERLKKETGKTGLHL